MNVGPLSVTISCAQRTPPLDYIFKSSGFRHMHHVNIDFAEEGGGGGDSGWDKEVACLTNLA